MSAVGAVLVANAPFRWTSALTALAAGARPLLAADGGANRLARIGVKPDLVIGDLDSIAESVAEWVGRDRLVHRPDQDRTDLDKALTHAFDELAVPRLTVLGALGGRADHEIGNLGLLARLCRGESLVFRDASAIVLAFDGELELPARPGETWSFWTFDPAVLLTVSGVRWPLVRTPVDAGGRPSIRNRATSDRVTLAAEGGAVLVMRSLDPEP